MNTIDFYKKKNTFFLISMLIFFIITLILNKSNHRFSMPDFEVYYKAANSFLEDSAIYNIDFREHHGEYKYSPFLLIPFSLFTKFSYDAACLIQFILISISITSLFLIFFKILDENFFLREIKSKSLALIFLAFSCFKYTTRELHIGNINTFILLFLSLFILSKNKGHYFFSSLLLAFAISAKPFFAIMILPLIIAREFKIILMTIISFILFELSPSFFIGISKNTFLHKQWLDVMINHSNSYDSRQTIFAILKTYTPFPLPEHLKYLIIASILSLYIFIFYNKIKKQDDSHFTFSWFLLISLIPNLFPNDFVQLIDSTFLILMCICFLFFWKAKKSLWMIVFFTLSILMYNINVADLMNAIQPGLAVLYEEKGLIGISNLLIVSFSTYIYFKYISKIKIDHANRTPT